VTRTTFPSTLSESYLYDAAGNLVSRTDRNGNSILYVYDALEKLRYSEIAGTVEVEQLSRLFLG